MVLPDEYAGYYPEEQTETIIDIAKPEAVGPMPPANYQIAGPLAEHKPDTAMKDAMASAGANVAGKVGEAALMGSDKAPAGSFFSKGLFGDFQFPWAASAGSAAPKLAAQLASTGAAPASYMGGLTATGAAAPAAAGLAPGMMAAAAPWALPALFGAKMFGLFNKGGGVGPLSPQYAGEGMYTFPIGHGAGAWDGYRGPVYEDFLEDSMFGIEPEDLVWDEISKDDSIPFNKGGNVQHKEHGGMTGPLSNNKSVKIEKKETIEYKN